MLTKLEVFSDETAAPMLSIPFDGSSSIQIRDITGLEPTKNTIALAQFVEIDGEAYLNTNVEKRNIVLTLGLNPDWATQTMASLRQQLYTQFLGKQKVTLRFYSTHLPTVTISGYVESFEPNIFSQDPEVQISVICPQPYFAAAPVVVNGLMDNNQVTINNPGNAPAGFVFKLSKKFGTPILNGFGITVTNVRGPKTDFMYAQPVIDDTYNQYVFSTVNGSKYLFSRSGDIGSTKSYIQTKNSSSVWLKLVPGVNKVSVTNHTDKHPWTLTYAPQFGGL